MSNLDYIFKGTKWADNPSARKIILGWMKAFYKAPSERLQGLIEDATGLVGDHLDTDWGNEREPLQEYEQ